MEAQQKRGAQMFFKFLVIIIIFNYLENTKIAGKGK